MVFFEYNFRFFFLEENVKILFNYLKVGQFSVVMGLIGINQYSYIDILFIDLFNVEMS